MAEKLIAWHIRADKKLMRLPGQAPEHEKDLEDWIETDPNVVDSDLLLIGRQVETDYGTCIDLMGLNSQGDLVIVELKRDRTPREAVAQALEYAAWASGLTYDRIVSIASQHFVTEEKFLKAFRNKFSQDLPEALNQTQRILLVAPRIPDGVRNLIEYLSETYGIPINAVSFDVFQAANERVLVRTVLLDDTDSRETGGKKRRSPTMGELLEMGMRNDAGAVTEYFYSLRDRFAAPVRYRANWAYVRKIGQKNLTYISVYPAAKPGAVVVQLAEENIATFAGRSLDETREFLTRLTTVIGKAEPLMWEGWPRCSFTDVEKAKEFMEELDSFTDRTSHEGATK